MKRSLLLFAILVSFEATSQCTPGANYADSLFGAWPDTISNFPMAGTGIPYSTDLNFKVPNDAGDIVAAYAGNTIVDFSVDNVTGLPPGINYSCNVSTCEYTGGANGCAQLSGTCNTPGVYNIEVKVTANLLIFGVTVPVPYTFSGYRIEVGQLGIQEYGFDNITISPNPVHTELFISADENFDKLEILALNGKVYLEQKDKLDNKVNLEQLAAGLYLLKLTNGTKQKVMKIVKM